MSSISRKIIFVIFLAAILQVSAIASRGIFLNFSPSDLFTSVVSSENIASLTNESRKSAGLPPLLFSSLLAEAAQQKAQDMLANQYFAHNAPSGKTPWNFMIEAGYAYLFAGENLAMRFQSSEEVLRGWLTSPSHRENILNNIYTEVGIGVAKGKFLNEEITVVVQMFGKPIPRQEFKRKILVRQPRIHFSKTTKRSLRQFIAAAQRDQSAVWLQNNTLQQIFGSSSDPVSVASTANILALFLLIGASIAFIRRLYKKKRR